MFLPSWVFFFFSVLVYVFVIFLRCLVVFGCLLFSKWGNKKADGKIWELVSLSRGWADFVEGTLLLGHGGLVTFSRENSSNLLAGGCPGCQLSWGCVKGGWGSEHSECISLLNPSTFGRFPRCLVVSSQKLSFNLFWELTSSFLPGQVRDGHWWLGE